MKKLIAFALLILSAAGVVCAQNQGNQSIPPGSSSGLTAVTTLPATCAVGQSFFLTTSSANFPAGQYNCPVLNTLVFVGASGAYNIYTADYGVTSAGNYVCDASTTSTTTVTTAAGDPAFTSAMNGWAVWGSNTCVDNTSYTSVVPVGTLTFVSAHQITVSVSATSTLTGSVHLTWGPVEDTALTASENAAWNYATTGGVCRTLNLNGGLTIIRQPHFNTFSCNNQNTGAASNGANLAGQGRASSLLMITPDFNFAACPTYGTFNTCLGGHNGFRKHDFGVTGGQMPGSNPAAQTCMMLDAVDSETFNIMMLGFGPTLGNLYAWCSTGINADAFNLSVDGFAARGGQFQAQTTECIFCFFGNNGLWNIRMGGSNAKLSTSESSYGPTNSSNGMVDFSACTPGCTWRSMQDTLGAGPASGAFLVCNGGCTAWIDQFADQTAAGSSFVEFNIGSGAGHILVQNSVAQGGTAAGGVFTSQSATGIFDDQGGNQFVCTAGLCLTLTTGSVFRVLVPSSTWSNAPPTGTTNCAAANVTNAVACAAWFQGSSAIASTQTAVTVTTSAVGANSVIDLTFDSSLGTKLGITCSTQSILTTGPPRVTARTPGTSFVVSVTAADAANPVCFNWDIRGTQ